MMDARKVQTIVPWVALAISVVALVVSLLVWLGRGGGPAQPALAPVPFSQPLSAPFPAPGQAVDLASMSPREAADRLFNRVMAASETGNLEEALRFAPMALQAYDQLGTLDNDARYHVALIHLTRSDIAGARAQVEQMKRSVPNHLLALMVEHQIAERSGDKAAAARANKSFLAAFDAEAATGRVEYRDHGSSIDRFREAAQASVAARK